MSEGTIRPEALANELGVSGKLVRAYLRKTFPRLPEAKNTAWVVTNDQANETRKHFLARRGQSPQTNASEGIAVARANGA
jgi:hypothetical protein